jgi:glycosyltransferase involved in cell wall biosynthesis
MVALEAAACGLAAVAMRDPALQDIVIDGKTGLLADENDDFVANLVRLTTNHEERAAFAAAAAEHALEFSVQNTARRMEELYYQVLEHNPPPRRDDIFDLEQHDFGHA